MVTGRSKSKTDSAPDRRGVVRTDRARVIHPFKRDILEDIINAVVDPIFIKDRQHRFLHVNDAFCRLFGKPRELLVGKVDREFLPPERAQAIWNEDESVLATGRETVGEQIVTDAEGRRRHLITKKSLVINDDGGTMLVGIAHDATEQKTVERELRISREFLQNVVDHVPAIISLWDPDLRCRFVNGHSRGLLLPPEECPGRHLSEVIGPEAAAAHRKYHEAVLAGREQRFEWSQIAPTGETRYFRIHFVPERAGEAVVGFFAFGVEITELKRTERQMIAARAAAEAASAAKSTFLAQMSHELRTPLNAMLGFAEMLLLDLDGDLSSRQREYLGYIADSARHQLALVQDLLDFAALDVGRLRLEIGEVDIAETFRSVRPAVQLLAEKAGVSLGFEHGEVRRLRADPVRLRQLLINLVSNAVKYSRLGGWIRVEAAAQANGRMRISVADNGEGILPGMERDLFRLSDRDDSRRRPADGAGFGLALVRQLTEGMGGCVGYERPEGPGSVFWIELPCGS